MMKKLFCLLVCAVAGFGYAATESVNGYRWTYTRDGQGVKITAVTPALSGDVVFPEKLGGMTVVNVAWDSQNENDAVSSVTLPSTLADGLTNGLSKVAKGSFNLENDGNASWPQALAKFRGLGSIALSGESAKWKIVDGVVFTRDGETLFFIPPAKESVTIPSTVRWIVRSFNGGISTFAVDMVGYNSHDNFRSVKQVEIEDVSPLLSVSLNMDHSWSLTRGGKEIAALALGGDVPSCAFQNCTSLKSVTLEESVRSIGYAAFAFCENLVEVSGGAGLVAVDGSAFEGTPLVDTAEDGLVFVGSWAVDYRGDLPETLVIPEGTRGFSFALSSSGDYPDYENRMVQDLTIPESCRQMESRVYFYGGSLRVPSLDFYYRKNFTISAAQNCSCDSPSDGNENYDLYAGGKLVTSAVIPASLGTVPDDLFAYCGSLTSVQLESGIVKVGEYAFAHCLNLSTAVLPDSLKSVGESAFYDCPELDFTLPSLLDELGEDAFKGSYAHDRSLAAAEAGDGIAYLGNWCLGCVWDEGGPTDVTIKAGTRGIVEYAFDGKSLKKVTIPSSVVTIGSHAFADTDLTTVTLPTGLKTLGWHAFASTKLTALPKLPASLERVGYAVFEACDDGMTPAYAKLPNGPVVKDGWLLGYKRYNYSYDSDCGHWHSDEENPVLEMPTELVVPSSVKHIADGTEDGEGDFDEVTDLTLPNGLLTIGSSAVCGELGAITIPATVTKIGVGAFPCARGPVSFLGKRPEVGFDPDLNWTFGDATVGYFATGASGWTNGMEFAGLTMEARVLSNGRLVAAVAVDVEQEGEGTVTGGVSGAYLSGTKLSLKAVPAAGYYFAGWSADGEIVSTAASLSYVVPDEAVTLKAVFKLDEIWIEEVEDVECAAGELLEIPVGITSGSALTFKAAGLPKGVSFDTKKMLLAGTPTVPGIYFVTITATNKSKNTEKLAFTLTVANFQSDYFEVEEFLDFIPGMVIDPIDLSFCGLDFDNGETLTVSGLPKGLAYNVKTYEITGKPTVPGVYTVTFTAKVKVEDAKGKMTTVTSVATTTWTVLDFPTLTLVPITDDETVGGTVSGGGSYLPGTKVTLKAKAISGYVFAGWYGLDDSRYTGDSRAPTLAYVAGTADEDIYACFVPAYEDAASLGLSLVTPVKGDEGDVYEEWDGSLYVGVQTTQQVAVASLSLPTVKVTGLPAGLKFNSKTYQIYGIPTKAGSYTITVKASNASGASLTETFDLTVSPLPTWAVGSFAGLIDLSIHPTGECYDGGHERVRGVMTLTVGTTGKISGKIQANGKSYPFTAPGYLCIRNGEKWYKACPYGHPVDYSDYSDMNGNRIYGDHCGVCGRDYPDGCEDHSLTWPRFIANLSIKIGKLTAQLPIAFEERGISEDGGDTVGCAWIYDEDGQQPRLTAPATFCGWWNLDMAQTLGSRKDLGVLPKRTLTKCLTGKEDEDTYCDALGEADWLTVKTAANGKVTVVGRVAGTAFSTVMDCVVGGLSEDGRVTTGSVPLTMAPNARTGYAGFTGWLRLAFGESGIAEIGLERWGW